MALQAEAAWRALSRAAGGWGRIRTHGGLAATPVFKTGALNHSATHPSSARSRRPYRPSQPALKRALLLPNPKRHLPSLRRLGAELWRHALARRAGETSQAAGEIELCVCVARARCPPDDVRAATPARAAHWSSCAAAHGWARLDHARGVLLRRDLIQSSASPPVRA